MNAMKTITRITVQILLFLLIAFTLIMSFHACQKIENPTKGVKLIVNYDILKTNINVRFFDAATGESIGMSDGENVDVNITGESASAVIDIAGESGKTYKSGGGYMTLYLNPNVEFHPSPDNPVRFTLVAQHEGYLQASRSMTITEEGDYFVDIPMIKSELPPEGVVIVKETEIGVVIQGEIKEDISLETENSEVLVFIPEGTVIKDENGNTLNGYLNIEITHFDNTNDHALSAFPGGLLSSLQKDGKTEKGVFYTAGFVAIEITDKVGKIAKTFEGNPFSLQLKVPEQTYNPLTSTYVNSGDGLAAHSFDPDEGLWNFEQQLNLDLTENGLVVNAQLNHLSYWNFGWFFGNTCDMGVDLLFTGNQSGCECVNVKGIMRKSEDDTFLRFVNMEVCKDEPVTIQNAPEGLPVYIEWENSDCSSFYIDPASNPLYINNMCDNQQYDVPLMNGSNQTTAVSIEITARCASYPDVEVNPTFGFWFREADATCWRYAFMYNGKADICDVEIGGDYVIGAYYENNWNEWQVTVTGSEYALINMELPDGVCNTLFD